MVKDFLLTLDVLAKRDVRDQYLILFDGLVSISITIHHSNITLNGVSTDVLAGLSRVRKYLRCYSYLPHPLFQDHNTMYTWLFPDDLSQRKFKKASKLATISLITAANESLYAVHI